MQGIPITPQPVQEAAGRDPEHVSDDSFSNYSLAGVAGPLTSLITISGYVRVFENSFTIAFMGMFAWVCWNL
jgi:hypothetical protein